MFFCQAFFHWFGGGLEKECALFVSDRDREHCLPDQLLDAIFKTGAAFCAELKENRIRSVADAENKRRFFCFPRFFNNLTVIHVGQWVSFPHSWCIELIAGIWRSQ